MAADTVNPTGREAIEQAIAQLRSTGLPGTVVQMIELSSRLSALASLLESEEHDLYLRRAAQAIERQLVSVAAQMQEQARPKIILPGMALPS